MRGGDLGSVISALLVLRRFVYALRYTVQEQGFLTVLGAATALVAIGTTTYTLGLDWNVADSLYFAVSTLTTTSVADPDLVLDDRWLKLFTIFYQLIGIGILVEVLRRLGLGFVAVREESATAKKSRPG